MASNCFYSPRVAHCPRAIGLKCSKGPVARKGIVAAFQESCSLSGRPGADATPQGMKPNGPEEGTYPITVDAADASSTQNRPRGWRGEPVPEPVVLGSFENSHPGESQSAGAAETAVRTTVSLTRALKVAL